MKPITILARVSLLLVIFCIISVGQVAAAPGGQPPTAPDGQAAPSGQAAHSNSLLSGMTSGANTSISNPLDGFGEGKPMMNEVLLFVFGLFVFCFILNTFGSGSVANLGSFAHNVSLRKGGIMGVLFGVLVIIIVCLAIIMGSHFYTKYLIGA